MVWNKLQTGDMWQTRAFITHTIITVFLQKTRYTFFFVPETIEQTLNAHKISFPRKSTGSIMKTIAQRLKQVFKSTRTKMFIDQLIITAIPGFSNTQTDTPKGFYPKTHQCSPLRSHMTGPFNEDNKSNLFTSPQMKAHKKQPPDS